MRVSLLLFLVTLAVFSRLLGCSFLIYDDRDYVTGNPIVCQGLSAAGWNWAWTTTHAFNWHPLTWLSHMADCQLFGVNPRGHHLVNAVLHAANAALLFLALRRLTGDVWRSAFVAALFALHPLHVQSVAWIAERKDVLSTFFGFLALWLYAAYVERPGLFRYLLVLSAFALSLLAKPTLVTLPFLLLLLDCWPLRRLTDLRRLRSVVAEKVPLLVLSAASCFVTVWAQGRAVVGIAGLPLQVRLANALVSYAGYLLQTVWPFHLSIYYPLQPEKLTWWRVGGAALVLVLISAAAILLRRSRPAVLLGWLWYLGTLVPVIGLVQVGNQAMADRYTYVPLIGIFIALAWLVAWPAALARLVPALALLVLGICALLTWRELAAWRNDETLWKHALNANEANSYAYYALGGYYYEKDRFAEADAHFRRALEVPPLFHEALFSAALSRSRQNDIDGALALARRAVAAAPGNPAYRDFLGVLQCLKGRPAEARVNLEEAVRLEPASAEHYFNLGSALAELEDQKAAQAAFRAGLERDPAWPQRAELIAQAWLNNKNPQLRSPAHALFRARQACAATPAPSASMLSTLADAYAAHGDLKQAIGAAQRALTAAAGDSEMASRIRAKLTSFEQLSPPK